MNKDFTAPALLVTSMLLVGCARPTIVREPVEVEVVRYETVPIPAILLDSCGTMFGPLVTNADLEAALAAAIITIADCNADKEAIRGLQERQLQPDRRDP